MNHNVFDQKPALFRGLLIGLVALVVGFALWVFYRYAGSATDENVFTTSPSTIYVQRDLPVQAVKITDAYSGQAASIGAADTMRRGELLISIARRKLLGTDDLLRAIRDIPPDSVLSVTAYRPHQNKYMGYRIRRAELASEAVREIPQSVSVVSVEAGGASDRAGVRVGDLIFRINGQSFGSANEADLILRRGTSGLTIQYDIIRPSGVVSLGVTLARFGIPLTNLLIALSGLIMLSVGVFIGLKASQFKSGRLLGLWFITLGFFIAVGSLRRDVDQSVFSSLRDVLIVLSGFLAITLAFQTHLHFPYDRPVSKLSRWIVIVLYVCAACSPLFLYASKSLTALLVITAVVAGGTIIYFLAIRKGTGEEQRILFVVKMALVVAIAGSLAFLVALSLLRQGQFVGFAAIFLLVHPAAYLYVIGRYRLFDIDLRVRRNVRYTVLSWAWGIVVFVLFLRVLNFLPTLAPSIPPIYFTGTAIEVGGSSASSGRQPVAAEVVFMVAAVGLSYGLWKLRKGGQTFIDKKYYQTRFDYRRAAAEMTDVLARQLSMKDLARSTVDRVADLLKLKRAGLFIFQDGELCCCHEATGIDLPSWEAVCPSINREFIQAVDSFKTLFRAEYLPEKWTNVVRAGEFPYLVPIRSKQTLLGVLLLGEKLAETRLKADDQAFIDAAAKQMAVSIENAFLYEQLAEQERLRHELGIARRIQLSSLPADTPNVPGLNIASLSAPASEVGGDFYDYLDGSGTSLTIIIGDVSGKGTSAALYMSKVQGILRSLHSFGLSPAELLVRANGLLRGDLEKSSFVTALAARFQKGDEAVTVVRAGHLPLYLYRATDHSVEIVLPRGIGLGLNDSSLFAAELEEKNIRFRDGDVLLFVTDGVTEARNAAGEEFGEQRIIDALSLSDNASAEAIRDHLAAKVRAFSNETLQHDDQTMVVVKAL